MGGGGGKKGGSTPKLPHYYMTIDYGACHGPLDSVNQIYVKEKPIWCGYLTEPSAVYVNHPDIFGGEEKEGGVEGVIECYFGTPDQKMSGVLADKLGLTPDTAPGYRDIAHFVFRGPEVGESTPTDSAGKVTKYLSDLLSNMLSVPASAARKGFHWITNNPYLPSAWINVTRLPTSLGETFSMILADPDADYGVDDPYASSWGLDPDEDPDTFDLTGWVTYPEPWYDTPLSEAAPPTIINLVEGLGIDPKVIDLGGCTVNIAWNTGTVGLIDAGAICTMYLNSWDGIEANWQGDPSSKLAFLGKSIGGLEHNKSLLFHTVEDGGTGSGSLGFAIAPGTRFITCAGGYAVWFLIFDTLSPNNPTGTITAAKIIPKHCGVDGKLYWLPDANPAHMIYECLTNADWGMGAPESTIHLASFTASASTLFGERFGLSMPWIQQAEIEKMVSEIIDHIQAVLYLDPEDGLWHLDLIRDDYDPDDLLVLDGTNSTSTNRQRKALGETINEIVISYKDAQSEEDKTVTFHDLGNIAQQGQLVSETRNYYGVRNDVLANKLGARDIRSASYPLFSADVQANREIGGKLKPGSVVKFTCSEDGISQMVVRVMKVSYGAPGDRYVRLNVIEDVFGLAQTEYTSIQETNWSDPDIPPVEIDTYLFDVPPLPLLLRSGISIDDISDDDYPATVVASYAYQSVATSYDLMTYTTAPNGAVSLSVVATLPMTPSGLLAADMVAEYESIWTHDQVVSIARRETPEEGDFIHIGGEGAASEVVMLDEYIESSTPTPIPDTPVWTTVDATAPTLHNQTAGAITITHTGDMDKSESYLTQADPDADFEFIFSMEATMAADSAATIGVFVGDDTVDRKQLAVALFYTGKMIRQQWNGLTFVREASLTPVVIPLPITDHPIFFKVSRVGNTLRFSYSEDGQNWTSIDYRTSLTLYIDNTAQVGVFLNSNVVTAGVTTKMVLNGFDTTQPPAEKTWRVARGMFDTVPLPWLTGDRAWFLSDFIDTLDPTENAVGAEKTYKLLPRSGGGTFAEANADPILYTPYDRPYLPLRPADTKLDGTAMGSPDVHYVSPAIPLTVTASWANRNRLTEDQLAVRWTDTNETPEDGQTTTLRVFERSTGDMVQEYEGLTGTSYDIDVGGLTDFRFYDVEFTSERDGYVSLTSSRRGLDLERLGYGNNYDYDYGENDGS